MGDWHFDNMLEISKAEALAMEASMRESREKAERKNKRKQAKASRKKNQAKGKK